MSLTSWYRVTDMCVSKLIIIGSDNGLSPDRRQAIIWTNARMLLIRNLGAKFSEILCEIHTFSFKKMHLKTSSAKWRPFCRVLNVLRTQRTTKQCCMISWGDDFAAKTRETIIQNNEFLTVGFHQIWKPQDRYLCLSNSVACKFPSGTRFLIWHNFCGFKIL